jgi:hypothetical protein
MRMRIAGSGWLVAYPEIMPWLISRRGIDFRSINSNAIDGSATNRQELNRKSWSASVKWIAPFGGYRDLMAESSLELLSRADVVGIRPSR